MKTLVACVASVLIGGFGAVAQAQEAWLLLQKDGHGVIAKADSGGVHAILDVGGQVIYGQSDQQLAVISQSSYERYALNLFDKASQKLLVTWPINGQVMAQVSGPTEDIVLKDGRAYFITLNEQSEKKPLANRQSQFDVNEISLSNGQLRKIALPKKCANPRLASLKGNVMVFSSSGNSVWQLNVERQSVDDVLLKDDIAEILESEDSADQAGKLLQGALAAFVSIPDNGVFRLSKSGALHQVVDTKLTPKAHPQAAAHSNLAGDIERVFPSSRSGKPMIGIVSKRKGLLMYSSINPSSMKTESEFELPAGAVAESVAPISDTVLFIDRKSATIDKVSSSGPVTVWKLNDFPKGLYTARIISTKNS